MTKKDEFSLIRAELNHNLKDQFLIALSNLNIVHIKQKEKSKIEDALTEREPILEKTKDLRKNLDTLLRRLDLSEGNLYDLKVDKSERIEFTAKNLLELISHIDEEIDFYNNRVAELRSYITKGTIELEKLKVIRICYKNLEKLNLTHNAIDSLKQFKFRVFTTFSKNLNNLKNLFTYSEFPNYYETFPISDERIGFYIFYPKDKDEEFNGRIRLIHSEEVFIMKKYLTVGGTNFTRIDKETNFIENLVSRYNKERRRLTDDNLLKFAGINETVQNIEEYLWAEQQFEPLSNSRLLLKFFVPSPEKEEIQEILFKIFKDEIILQSIDISKKQPSHETPSIKTGGESSKIKSSEEIKFKEDSKETEEYKEEEDLRDVSPTIMKNFFLVRPFETITKMYGTPTYSEIDPTPIIAITFPILFGLMFGDIGHGIVLIIAGLLGALKFRKRSGDTYNFSWIIVYCGIAAFFVGFLYGEFLGHHEIEIFGTVLWHLEPINLLSILPSPTILLTISAIGVIALIIGGIDRFITQSNFGKWLIGIGIAASLLPLILLLISSELDITLYNPLHNILNVFFFAVLIGVFHINLGWFVQFLNYWKQKRKFLAVSDSLTKILLLTGGTVLIFGYGFNIDVWIAYPYPILLTVIPGLLLLLLKPLGKIFKISYLQEESIGGLIGEGSIEAFDTVLSVMSNVASYIRLLALALAHIALLTSINAMMGIVEGVGIGKEIADLIGGIFGNMIVILLEGLLVFLNTIRLHFYEFFFKFYNGAGIEYFPFYLDDDYSVLNFQVGIEKDVISEEIEREIDIESIKEEVEKATNYIVNKFK
jgi:vacuolar-type H+-ATPase subunit I/STV1